MMIGSNNAITLAYNNLSATNLAMEKTARALSTGLRAATAADDASGIAIGMNISANIAGVTRAIKNAQDGVSMLQTAEGGLNQINSMLQRMRELAIEAANDTMTSQDRKYIQMEIDELRNNVDNIAANTTFNCKRLLDGSSAAIWSSDKDSTKLKINGAVTILDQFGQRKSADGNYRIEIKANAGQGQIQKSSPMIIAKNNVVMDKTINTGAGISKVAINNLPSGNYRISGSTAEESGASISSSYGLSMEELSEALTVTTGSDSLTKNASILFEVTGTNDGAIRLRATSRVTGIDGITENYLKDNITLTEGGSTDLRALLGISDLDDDGEEIESPFTLSLQEDTAENFTVGYKFVYNLTASEADRTITIASTDTIPEEELEDTENYEYPFECRFNIDSEAVKGNVLRFRSFHVDSITGEAYDSEVSLSVSASQELAENAVYAEFRAAGIGDIPEYDTSLRDINTFYNADGVYMFEQPQKITITQGNGKQAEITIYAEDTIEDLRSKLNNAIADDLGQTLYTDNKENFVSFVREGFETSAGSEAVAGTFVIRSAVAGSAGKITLTSDNNDLLNALGLNTITEAKDNSFTASVYDAHTGGLIASNIEAGNNTLYGVISPNVEIEFDSMANVKALWNDNTKNYDLRSETELYNTIVHISDKSTAFQVGSKDGEDIYINIADMRSEALGLNRVDVSTRARASDSITALDMAIRKVSIQRTRIGAYQNELEYNTNSLTQTSLYLQGSESRIKDADMATEFMEFVKLQILTNTGNSMLAQANHSSQAVMNMLMM